MPPSSRDWTAIYVEQRNRAATQFGAFEQAGPNSKKVPHLAASYAREVGGYWLTEGQRAKAGRVAKLPEERRASFNKALATFAAEMQPFGSTVLAEPLKLVNPSAASDELMLSFDASVNFWAAVRGFAIAMAGAGVVPLASDLWWKALSESAKDLARNAANAAADVIDTVGGAGKWIVVGLIAYAALELLRDERRNRRA